MSAAGSGAELKRALRAYFESLGAPVAFESLASRPWASITFSGERHRLSLCLPGPGAAAAVDTFLDGLGEREFVLRSHILADIEAVSVTHDEDGQIRVLLEALTVEDA